MPPWDKYGAGTASPWERYGRAPTRPDADVLAEVSAEYKTPQGRLAAGGLPETQTFGQYAGNFLKKAAIPAVTTTAGATLGLPGAMAGAGFGEFLNQTLRVGERDSVFPEVNQPKIDPTAIGIATAAPAVVQGTVTGAQKVARSLHRNLTPGGMVENFLRKRLGPDIDDVANALDTPPLLHGYPQTAAEKLTGKEFGGVIQGNQQAVAKTPGGISTEFGKLKKFQNMIIGDPDAGTAALRAGQARLNRDAATAPLRDQALQAANGQNGVRVKDIVKYVNDQLRTPEVIGSPETKEAILRVGKALKGMTDQYGRVDAASLYQFKKDGLDKVVAGIVNKTDPHSSVKFKGTEFIGIKDAIDDTLEKASGGLWSKYLGEYSSKSKVIDALTEARGLMYKPVQAVDPRGGVDIAPSAAHQVLPPWLSRPVTTTKWLAEKYASHIEPKIDRRLADIYQHPDQLASVIRGFKQPSRYQSIVDALVTGGRPLSAGVAAQYEE